MIGVPSPLEVGAAELLAIAGSLGGVCARQRRAVPSPVAGEVAVVLPAATAQPRSVGVSVGAAGCGEPREPSRVPHPVYIAQRDRGPPPIARVSAPDQGADQGLDGPLGPLGRRSI